MVELNVLSNWNKTGEVSLKFGYIDFDSTVKDYWNRAWNKKALLNIGDAAEYLVVEQIYRSLSIPRQQMKKLCIADLTQYRGESLIVPMNIALDSYVGYNDILENLSPDIIPIFLGMSFTDLNLNEKQIRCLRNYAPIGCRDERSYLGMKRLGIPAYLNGCTASILEIQEKPRPEFKDKVVFIDVPYGVLEYVPQEMRADIVCLNQEVYCRQDEQPEGFIPSQWAKQVFSCYCSQPKMIVTSRFHGAVLALSKNIPVILTLERYTFRFSWLRNYVPIYTEYDFASIDWTPPNIEYSHTRDLIMKTSKNRIMKVIENYQDMLKLTDLQRSYLQEEQDSSNQVYYYRRAWEELQQRWRPEKEYLYGFWGVNENTKKLYELISQKYPNAKLINIFDMFKTVEFNGVTSVPPKEIDEYVGRENFYLIVTAYLASRVAPDICQECGFKMDHVILCERDFIKVDDF